MIDEKEISRKVAEVEALLETRLGVRGRSLDHRLRRAGRRLPARIRRDAALLAEAERLAAHPKLSRRIEPEKLARAVRSVTTHLTAIDPADRRRGQVLSVLGSIAFGLIVVAALLVTVLVWRGFV